MNRSKSGIFWIYAGVEILLFFIFGKAFGGWAVFFEIILSGAIGMLLILRSLDRLKIAFYKISKFEILDFITQGISHVIGGLLLIMPGLLSDVLGLLLVIFASTKQRQRENKRDMFEQTQRPDERMGDREIIDVEVIEQDVK
ncbi:MAG: FxsA family protein [Helicobacter sp.]|nr:FxsA family protein [Helicobacter sp.]